MNPTPLGQHFLINQNIASKMILNLFPARGPILEIGPGRGILSDLLIRHRVNNKLILVEKDRFLAEEIQKKYRENCLIINADILDIELDKLLFREKLNLIGNIPYYISKELIDWIIRQSRFIRRGILMMQREFVVKTIRISNSKANNARSLMFRTLFQSKKICDVKPGSFSPPPDVISTVFNFQPRPGQDKIPSQSEFYQFLQQAFKSRRKTLFNNLIGVYGKDKLNATFCSGKIKNNLRAEQLGLPDFLKIYSGLTHNR